MNISTHTAYQLTMLLLSTLILAASPCYGAVRTDVSSPEVTILDTLDSDFQVVLHDYLKEYAKHREIKTHTNVQSLIAALDQESNALKASNLIRAHLDLIIADSSKAELRTVLTQLYKSNDTATVRDITQALIKSKSSGKITLNYFLLAKYYLERHQWQGILAALSKIDTTLLQPQDAQYAAMLKGFALQGTKQHRKSVVHYQSIAKNSPYYPHAKLNEGTAYLRQGWWTEAHIEFNKAIEALQENPVRQSSNPDFANRIITSLGFSQIHYEFYRDARETLRKIDLNSEYTNKAMMGLGIAAAHQKDFSGALNIFDLLSQKRPKDKNVDEAYLLVPFGYEELKDPTNAAIKYQLAIQYFQLRLAELQKAALTLDTAQNHQLDQTVQDLNQNAKELYSNQDMVPEYFLSNYRQLELMQKVPLRVSSSAVNKLLSLYQQTLKSMVAQNIQLRQAAINSYLSQAKFGVAKLYDQ